jgi:apolipoprotein N-acyltransferase
VLRAANNGISAVIDPWGRVLAKTGLNESGVLTAKAAVCPGAPLTFYASRGEWFIYVCLMLVAAFLLAVFLV